MVTNGQLAAALVFIVSFTVAMVSIPATKEIRYRKKNAHARQAR